MAEHTCYLNRSDVRSLLIAQPDENLDITEAILHDIDQLQVHTAEGIRADAPSGFSPIDFKMLFDALRMAESQIAYLDPKKQSARTADALEQVGIALKAVAAASRSAAIAAGPSPGRQAEGVTSPCEFDPEGFKKYAAPTTSPEPDAVREDRWSDALSAIKSITANPVRAGQHLDIRIVGPGCSVTLLELDDFRDLVARARLAGPISRNDETSGGAQS